MSTYSQKGGGKSSIHNYHVPGCTVVSEMMSRVAGNYGTVGTHTQYGTVP